MSRFVSAGSIDAATGEATESVKLTGHAAAPSRRNEEWKAAQEKLEADRRRREEQQRRQVGQDAEKSLYEVLQANKAAKQAAFEEASRLKNQFRALHDEEIDFLDGVRASARAEEERLRRETEEGLKAFRAARDAAAPRASSANGGGGDGPSNTTADGEGELGHHGEEEADWAAAGRSRRRRPGRKGAAAGVVIKGVKRRASEIEGGRLEEAREGDDGKRGGIDGGDGSSLPAAEAHNGSLGEAEPGKLGAQADPSAPSTSNATDAPAKADGRGLAKKAKLGLVAYGSSDDQDDG